MPVKKTTDTPAKMGRPPIEIDWKQFDQMCALHCTKKEIAALFFCCEETIENKVMEQWGMTFSAYFEQKSADGKKALRRKQLEVALNGNATMLIWLGKQHLGQADKIENNNINNDTVKMSVVEDADSKKLQEKLKKDPKARELLKEVARKLGKF